FELVIAAFANRLLPRGRRPIAIVRVNEAQPEHAVADPSLRGKPEHALCATAHEGEPTRERVGLPEDRPYSFHDVAVAFLGGPHRLLEDDRLRLPALGDIERDA